MGEAMDMKIILEKWLARIQKKEFESDFNTNSDRNNWVPNSSNRCRECGEKFGMFQRYHHCRFCGGLVHDNHSKQRIRIDNENHRACNNCYAKHKHVIQKHDNITSYEKREPVVLRRLLEQSHDSI